MRSVQLLALPIAVATTALALSTPTVAQVTSVATSGFVATTPDFTGVTSGSPIPLVGSLNNQAFQFNGNTGSTGSGPVGSQNYQVSGLVTPNDVVFADNTTTQGYNASTTATSTVTVTYVNGGAGSVTPKLQSTIIPGGFGFYVDTPVPNDINQSTPSTSNTFNTLNLIGSVARASFSFDIYSGSATDPSHLVASFSDYVALNVSLTIGAGGVGVFTDTITTGPTPALNGFAQITPIGSNVAVGYQWNATSLYAPLGVTLAPGEFGQLTYVSSVTTSTNTEIQCGAAVCDSLLAYSGFGDPVGRAGDSGGADPYFARLELGLPTFDPVTGMVQETLLPTSLPSLALPNVPPAPFHPVPMSILLGVPEPETWALLLIGFGLVGAATRRRRRLA
jgi:hypothetical protein